ncbi:MAG: M14 family metallopeptidase [Gammaproteobacteria bacterium]|nr:M14 family metallopeptidase [Gammaproteobacteria bacterium]
MSENLYPVQIEGPDISPYRKGNTGIDYVHTLDSGVPGPHLMVSAVVHGNELCGAIALDNLFRSEFRPVRGKVTLGFMNVAAYETFDPGNPTASRFVDEDFNRVWDNETLDGERDSVELSRAREVRRVIDQIDHLLDVHSMQHATVPLMMCGVLEKGRRLARRVGAPEHIVSDAGHAAGRRMRDYGAFSDPSSEKSALLVECGQHWAASSVDVAMDVVLRFIASFEAASQEFIDSHMEHSPPPIQYLVEVTAPVTIESDAFRFAGDFRGMEIIPLAGTVIGWDGDREVRTPYNDCVLIMPSRRLRKGESAVRFGRFVA